MHTFVHVNKQLLFGLILWLGITASVQSAVIQRTITIDGNFTDWTTPTDITTNPGQNSFDQIESAITLPNTCLDLDASFKATPSPGGCLLQSTGRDLKTFAYTFDNNRLYLYVNRYASTTNITDWYFYFDADGNGTLSSTERVLHVGWRGSNGITTIALYTYNPALPGGDVIVGGDGYTMPGSLGAGQTYSLPASIKGGNTAGANAGVEMETQVLWSEVCAGCVGPQSIRFHISSGNNTNLPSGIIDNMDGPPGGIVTYDLQVAKTVSAASVTVSEAFSYTITVDHSVASAGNATAVTLTDLLPAEVTYVSHSAGETYDPVTGVWAAGDIPLGGSASITINVVANTVADPVTNTVTLDVPDTDDTNSTGSVDVAITPALPLLSITKVSNRTSANPMDVIQYTITVQNMGVADATDVLLDDDMSAYSAIDIDWDNNAGNGLDPFSFNAIDSTLSISSRTYTEDNGADGYTYSPLVSGGDGASAGFDGKVTDWRIQMSGSMPAGTSFTITYQVEVN